MFCDRAGSVGDSLTRDIRERLRDVKLGYQPQTSPDTQSQAHVAVAAVAGD